MNNVDSPTTTNASNPAPSTDVPDPPMPVGVFPALDVGEVVSVQLENGFPLWLVRHDDGSVSAVPGIVETISTPLYPADDTVRLVAWLEGARRFSGRALHDEWGRTLNDGRHADLAGYVATLTDGQIHVARSETPMPGLPFFDGPRESSAFVRPTLRTPPGPQLGPGWWQLSANVITTAGESRICANPDPTPCPPDAPLVPHLVDTDPGTVLWRAGPVIVHQNDDGHIDEIAVLGGSSRSSTTATD